MYSLMASTYLTTVVPTKPQAVLTSSTHPLPSEVCIMSTAPKSSPSAAMALIEVVLTSSEGVTSRIANIQPPSRLRTASLNLLLSAYPSRLRFSCVCITLPLNTCTRYSFRSRSSIPIVYRGASTTSSGSVATTIPLPADAVVRVRQYTTPSGTHDK